MWTTKIVGTGSCTPEKIITNHDLSKIVDTSDEWIRSRTGIGERRITEELTTAGLAAKAAQRALLDADMKAEDLELILVATSSPEHFFPSAACEVQGIIGGKNAVAYDLSAACSGFLFALNTAYSFLKSGCYKNALVIGADVMSKIVDWKDRSTCVHFGDGAGAAIIRAELEEDTEKPAGIHHFIMGSDGSGAEVLTCTARSNGNFLLGKESQMGYLSMNGQEVFKFAVKKVPECISQLLCEADEKKEEISYFILHQANYRIIESVAKRLKLPLERFPMNIEHYGNTSGASIPILLDELNRSGELSRGDKLVLSGFGAGLTWGAVLLTW